MIEDLRMDAQISHEQFKSKVFENQRLKDSLLIQEKHTSALHRKLNQHQKTNDEIEYQLIAK